MKLIYIFLLIAVVFSNIVEARERAPQFLGWHSYTNILKVDKNTSINTEIHERHFWNPLAQHQFAYAMRIQRDVGEKRKWSVVPGFAYFRHNTPADPHREIQLVIPELRPQLDINYKQVLKNATLFHRHRFETRIFRKSDIANHVLEEGYEFNSFKMRYQFLASFPLVEFGENQKLYFRMGDELHFHFGKKVGKKYFDHNRFSSSLMVDVVPTLALELGYQHWYHQLSTGEGLQRHLIRVGIQQTITLKPKSQ